MQDVDPHRLEVGRRLADLRDRLGMTQVDFAASLGVSYRSIQGYESGKYDVSTEVLKALRARYGRSCDWLLFGPEDAPETANRFSPAMDMAKRVYEVWETLLSEASLPVPVEAKTLLFNVFVEIAVRDGELPMAQMQQAAKSLIERVKPKT